MVQKLEKGPVPLYYQLEQILRSQIANKEIGPNELLPTEMELCELYDVSRATVRQAIRALEDDELIMREQGRGTTVVDKSITQRKVKVFSSVNDLLAIGLTTHVKILSKRLVTPPAGLIKDGYFIKGEKVYFLKGMRTIVKPTKFSAVVHYYTPKHIGQDISAKQVSGGIGIIEEIERITGMKAQSIKQEISAISANKQLADALKIDVGTPTLKIKRVFLTSGKSILQCATTFVAHQHFKYETEIVMV